MTIFTCIYGGVCPFYVGFLDELCVNHTKYSLHVTRRHLPILVINIYIKVLCCTGARAVFYTGVIHLWVPYTNIIFKILYFYYFFYNGK